MKKCDFSIHPIMSRGSTECEKPMVYDHFGGEIYTI